MLKRALGLFANLLLIVLLVTGGLGVYTARSQWPRITGAVDAPGLRGSVEIARDRDGVPHIYADTTHDLFFAQGYVHAQDRFWQMEFWRRIGQGRLSEVFGPDTVEVDRFLRTLGWARVAQQEFDTLFSPEEIEILEAYAAGVNAYLAERPHDLGLEWKALGLSGVDYAPEPWIPLHTLTWAKAMAWDLSANLDSELQRARLIQALGAERAREYLPAYPPDHPLIVPPGVAYAGLDTAVYAPAQRLRALLGGAGRGLGSNSWAVAGTRTAGGAALLANDPHLGIQMPSIWYEVHLHCRALSEACPYQVAGVSFAGAPGVILGHNHRIAWGFTNAAPDVQDLYVERLNPENPLQYEVNGVWADMQLIPETIRVRGAADVNVLVRVTRHGPLLDEVQPAAAALAQDWPPGDAAPQQALALRWTALEPSRTFAAVWMLNRARNWDEFRAAMRLFDVPSQNAVYADVDGNIGYQLPGRIPIRLHGDGLLPVPGWSSQYEWTGYIPFDELPSLLNPPQGYIVAANNAVVGPEYPYLLSLEWDRGYRAQRVTDLLDSAQALTVEDFQSMQTDNFNLSAQEILPYLLALPFDSEAEPELADSARRLAGWDLQNAADSVPAAIYETFWAGLLARAHPADLPPDLRPTGDDVDRLRMRLLLAQPDSPWWDDAATPEVERRDDALRLALADGRALLQERLGGNPDRWTWGRLHTAHFRNATLGESGVAPIEALFNRGPAPAAGGPAIVNATSYDLREGFGVTALPSMRMIVDLGDLGNSRIMHTTGQSGHPFNPHYADMIRRWQRGEYHPMRWERAAIEADIEGRLLLQP